MISAILACKIRQAKYYMCLTESTAPLCRALNRADAQRESKRLREKERERGVRTLWQQDLTRQSRQFSEIRLGCFFEGKKGVCNVAKLATRCISISPNTGWATSQTENMRCVNCLLIKWLPLKFICALTLTALIYIYIYIYIQCLKWGKKRGASTHPTHPTPPPPLF